jgi:hypothetical protein
MHFAENPDWRNSFNQLPSQSAFRLKANEYDCVVGITDAVIKVVLNSPSGAHAASGDDYAWLAELVQGFALLNSCHDCQAGEGERFVAASKFPARFFVVKFSVSLVNPQDFASHRAVNENRDYRQLPTFNQIVQRVKHLLSSPDSETGDENSPTLLKLSR